ncbi:TRAP transporter substrate-binding protein [Paracoccus sp. M683]|nr:TRAP transporter substrate-binding protein [Paracoccus sp. M683]
MSASPVNFMQPWAEKIERDSGGRIKIELYPSMQLGGTPQELFDMVRDGVVDGAWFAPSYQPGRFPKVEALELPFMTTKSAEEASRAAWVYGQKHLLDDFQGVKVIAMQMHGRGIIHKRGDPVVALEDFRGLKLRGPSRPAALLLEKLGATAIGIPVPAFPEALAKGVLDGGVIPWELAPSLKLNELAPAHTDVAGEMSFYNLFLVWGMNQATYDALPDDLKLVIDANSGFATSAWAGRALDIGDAEGRRQMEQAGNAITQLSPEVTRQMHELGDQVIAGWATDMTAKGLDAQGLLSDARAAVQVTRDLPGARAY